MNPSFIEMLQGLNDPRFAELPQVLTQTDPEVSIRLNPRKNSDTTITYECDGKVPWWELGFYLKTRPRFTFDPALHQGRYYVQDASSMVISAVARELARRLGGEPLLWLDACAAPGGKTTAAIDALPAGSLVVANEYDYKRAEILLENVTKWGYPGTVVTRGDTARYSSLKGLFDVIAIDAPCSGEGMMRKDAVACQQWTPALVEECAERQREIIGNLWKALRPGGYLVYSTCTFNTVEDEDIVRWIIENYDAEPIDLTASELPEAAAVFSAIDGSVGGDIPALRFIPGRVRGEGLFMSVLRKPGDAQNVVLNLSEKRTAKKHKSVNKKSAIPPQVSQWIRQSEDNPLAINVYDDVIYAFPARWEGLLPLFRKELQVIGCGVGLAEIKGRDIVPLHSLALSSALNPEAFTSVEIDEPLALDYLSREALVLREDIPKGYILLYHNGYPLGFVKNLGNRTNNLYPKEWRIRSKG